jgi:uncharacterized repeat protein (TIGR02543 family)
MKKRVFSIFLVLAMCLSMVAMTASATDTPPLELVSSVDGTTVTLTLKTTAQIKITSLEITLNIPEGLTASSIEKAEDYDSAGLLNLTTNTNKNGSVYAAAYSSEDAAATVESGKALVTFKYTATDATYATYNFSATFDPSNDIDDTSFDWKNGTITATATVGTAGHTHNANYTAANPATCEHAGTVAYYYCSGCGKYFSDEACSTEITQAETEIAQKAHDYSGTGNTCVNGCGQVQPAYEVYYELYDSTGNTKLTASDLTGTYVYPGTTYIAKVFISANSEQTLRYFDINLSYDTEKIENVTNDETVKVYNSATTTTAGAIRYYLYQRNNMATTVSSTTPLQVAQFNFKVKDSVENGNTLTLGFDNSKLNRVGKDNDTAEIDATTTSLTMAAKIITITWNGNGGMFGTETTKTTTVAYNGTPEAPSGALSRAGYTQNGWLDAATGNAVNLADQKLTANTEYFANWTAKKYTIIYDVHGGDALSSTTVEYTIESTFTLPAPTRAGYDFAGWQATMLDSNGTNIPENHMFQSTDSLKDYYGNVTLTAQWTAKTYTVTFDLNGGAWGETSVTTPYTYTIEIESALPTPTRTGYTFAGWKATTIASGTGTTNIEKDNVFAKNSSLKGYYGDVTLTAQWTVNANAEVVEYGYAPDGYQLLVVSAVPGDENYGVYVDVDGTPTAMYYMDGTTGAKYIEKISKGAFTNATGVYVYLIKYSADDEIPTITIQSGKNESLTFDGIMYGTTLNYNDASIVNEMNIQTNKGKWYSVDQLSLRCRLQADMNHDCTVDLGDVSAIVNLIQTPAN